VCRTYYRNRKDLSNTYTYTYTYTYKFTHTHIHVQIPDISKFVYEDRLLHVEDDIHTYTYTHIHVQIPEISKFVHEDRLMHVEDTAGRVLKEGSMRLWINDPESGQKAPVMFSYNIFMHVCVPVFVCVCV
jgi:hypothetical protein